MRTDSLFYLIFQTQPSILFELLGDTNPKASTYSFASQEIKETSFRIDGIFVPPIHATNLPIFFVEIQGYKDTKKVLYSSFFSQIFLYLQGLPTSQRLAQHINFHQTQSRSRLTQTVSRLC